MKSKSSTLFSGGLFWRQLRFGGNCSTLFSGGLFWRQFRFGGNHNKKTGTTTQLYQLNNPLENNVKRVPAKSSTLFSGGLFWRQLRFGGNCSTLFSSGLFWSQLRFGGNHNKKTDTTTQLYRLRFGGNWLHIIFQNVLHQFELKLVQIRYIQIWYIQICAKIGWFRIDRTRGINISNRLPARQTTGIIFFPVVITIAHTKNDTTAQLYCTLSTYVTPKTISRQNQKI